MTEQSTIQLRQPSLQDGSAVWELVRRCRPLDLNSSYLYLILCEHFSDTCLVAEAGGNVIGFVSAYRPPSREDTLFVWQIAVDPQARGQGIAKQLLNRLIATASEKGMGMLEATVSPSNEASKRLFRSVAKEHNVECKESPYLSKDVFPTEEEHEEEALFQLGPFPNPAKENKQ